MTPRDLGKLLDPLRRRVQLMVGRCIVNLVDDALKMQGVQITLLSDETRDKVERLQNYGFTSNPLPGAEAVALAVGGTRNHAVVVVCDDRRYRLKGLESGEVAVYTDEGDKIVLKRGNVIEITSATKVRLVTPLVEMSQDAHVMGSLIVDGLISGTGGLAISGGAGAALTGGALTHDGVNIGKTHVHSGVQAGVANTAGPH